MQESRDQWGLPQWFAAWAHVHTDVLNVLVLQVKGGQLKVSTALYSLISLNEQWLGPRPRTVQSVLSLSHLPQ